MGSEQREIQNLYNDLAKLGSKLLTAERTIRLLKAEIKELKTLNKKLSKS